MSRTKKSRKPGAGSIGIVKEDKKKAIAPVPRKPKKKTGKQAGNRQKEATEKLKANTANTVNKDPRIGNKTPIDLGKPVVLEQKNKQVKKKHESTPIAAIRVIETGDSLAEQLEKIEQDAKLLEILEKQDADIALTSEDVDYYNELMEKHEQISEKLGLSEEEDVSPMTHKSESEDDLWDKFDSSDLSKFE